MRLSLNALHLVSVVVPALAWGFGAPWFICAPIALLLLGGAIVITAFVTAVAESGEIDEQ